MADGDLVTDEWEMEYRGLAFGGDHPISLAQIEGLADLPEVRSSDHPLLRRHGLHPGSDYLGGREIILTLEVEASDDAELATLMTAISTAFRVDPSAGEAPLIMIVPGFAGGNKVRLYVRPRGRVAPIDLAWKYRLPVVVIRMVATDPRIYSDAVNEETTTLPAASGGLTFPLTFPLNFGGSASGGSVTALNAGSFPTHWLARIDGPVTNPTLESLTEDKLIQISIVLADGEYLLIDSEHRTVMLNGTASRYHLLDAASEWFDLIPGTNEITFRATATTDATVTLTWRSAWS